MMLTARGRYAVMAMVDLALYSQNKPVTLADIATRQEITQAYLEQIFARLKADGLVKSVRGPGGGYLLMRPAEKMSVAEIVLSQDEKIKMTRCNSHENHGCMAGRAKCLTHDLWDGLSNSIRGYLSSVSLADVCEKRVGVVVVEKPSSPESRSDYRATHHKAGMDSPILFASQKVGE